MMWRLSRQSDLIYATDLYSVGYFSWLLKKLTGKKYIIRFAGDSAWEAAVNRGLTHDYILDFQNKNYGEPIEKAKSRRKKILIGADKVIAVSKFMGRIAELIGVDQDNIRVIYNAVDFSGQSAAAGAKTKAIRAQYANGRRLIVTACRLTPWKGVDGIIKIMSRLKEKIGETNLLVLGDGSELANLRSLANSLGLNDNVYFLGRLDRAAMPEYFSAADAFVLNTNYEGLSHTLLEAMSAGTPIVTTNVGGNPELIENNAEGILVDYDNPDQLFTAILRVLTDQSLAAALAERAKSKLKSFTWDKVISQTDNVLNEVCHG
jgi:glycosyltransferase involved in cell wall biosynthesis